MFQGKKYGVENHRTWEIGDKERIEMAKEFGGKKRAQSYGSQESRIWKQAWGDLQCNDWRKNE